MYQLLTSARRSDDLFIGFDPDRNRRQQELINNKQIKGKYHIGIMLSHIFVFVEHQGKPT